MARRGGLLGVFHQLHPRARDSVGTTSYTMPGGLGEWKKFLFIPYMSSARRRRFPPLSGFIKNPNLLRNLGASQERDNIQLEGTPDR